ncbi:MAG: FG-GAP repeat domain-containing protein [Verrucomicrobiales bacterium]
MVLSTCGDGGREGATPAPAKIEVSNETISLRLKHIAREDRLPPKAEVGVLPTAIGIAPEVATVEPGSAWGDEVFAQAALVQMEKLSSAARAEELAGLIAERFRCSDLSLPAASQGEVDPGQITLEVGGHERESMQQVGADQLLASLGELGHLKLKITGVGAADPTSENRTTQVRAEADGEGYEYSAAWRCEWAPGDPPKLRSLQVEKYEITRTARHWFVDATRSAIGGSKRFDPQVMRGIEYWSQRITRIGDMSLTGHHGIAIGDVNGDGLEDVYVCDAGSLPNQLYLQQADGTAKESAGDATALLEDSRSALLVDLDGDGDQDLVVATIAMIYFAENSGDGSFTPRGGFPGARYPFSLSAADFDNDGDLDLYCCLYSAGDDSPAGRRGFEARSPTPFNDANNGGRNVLLANMGNFQFGDVTDQVGLDQNNSRWSFAAAWEDYDRDGDVDLYVANDFGRNCLYRNDAGRFTDVAAEAGVEDMAAGMSATWGDPNRDGAADLYVGNMYSSAGKRVGYQRNFEAGLQRMARGNTLFEGAVGSPSFTDISLEAGVTAGGWAWSSAFADLDNDGWQDIVVANGYLTNQRADDL